MSRKPITKRSPVAAKKNPPDKALLLFTIIMAVFGTIMIFDASVYQANRLFSDQFYFLKLHLVWLLIGGFLGFIFYSVDYKKLTKLSYLGLGAVMFLLVAVLIFGNEINGSKRWFAVGPLPIQPAELAKPMIILYLASWLTKAGNSRDSQRKQFMSKLTSFVIMLAFILGLIVLEPDLGTTMIIAMTSFSMFFVSDTSALHTIGSLAIAGVLGLAGLLAGILESYRLSRIKTFLSLIFKGVVEDPRGAGYQIQQILIGIGSAGFWGKGFGQSRQRFGYLVENTAFTDSIFAIILEELGFVGGFILVSLWIFFLWKGLQIARRVDDKQGQLLATGIIIWLSLQAFLNMAANVGLIPLTGIPLPLITYGGSNTLVTIIGLALLLNVSRYSNGKTEK